MADKFGIGSGPHELKIGNSFANRAGKNGAGHPGNFHTIRYDFKPASLDPSKSGVLAVTENSLNVKVPHSNGSTETNYSGHCTDSSQKECVLIIDQTTGEITLEKLSSHMRLKKTRQERPEKSVQIEKMINSGSTAPSNISTNSNPPGHNSSRPQTPVSAFKRDSPVATPKPLSRSASPHIPNQQTTSLASAAKVSLSESSSDSSSSGSDSDSDLEDGPPFQKAPVEPSMPSFLDSEPLPVIERHNHNTVTATRPPQRPLIPQQPSSGLSRPSSAASMPQILNDDLQLSESEDDSD